MDPEFAVNFSEAKHELAVRRTRALSQKTTSLTSNIKRESEKCLLGTSKFGNPTWSFKSLVPGFGLAFARPQTLQALGPNES